jgi:hypothetical protein
MNTGGYRAIRKRLTERIEEPAPGRIQMLTGPRQVGKTTILLEIARKWGESALYLAADASEASLPGWWELQWRRALSLARTRKSILLLDEIQYLPNWSRLVKAGIDEVYRENLPLHIVLTGSAALELGAGVRETMAGRYERLILRQWTVGDLASEFSLTDEQAVINYVRFGSFPGGMNLLSDLPRWQAYMRDSIIDPAVGRDLLMLESVKKPALLRQVFAVCAGHPSEILSLRKIAGEITDYGASETIAHYLNLLAEAYLVASLQKYSQAEIRRRSSPPKVVPLSNAFLAATSQNDPPTRDSDQARWGRWVENACLAFAVGCEQSLFYWRYDNLEVDALTIGSWGKLALEVKTGDYTTRDLAGLLEFCRRYPDFQPLVICDPQHTALAGKLGINAKSWQEFLWTGPA